MNLRQRLRVWRALRYGAQIECAGAFLENVRFFISGKRVTIRIGAGSLLSGVDFRIWGDDHRVEIGERCRVGRNSEIWIEDNSCELRIGAGSTFQHNIHLALTEDDSKMTIGKDCMFAYAIDVRTGDSHSIVEATTGKRINPAKNVEIGDHVWIGAHSSILKGSVIRSDSVVATRSVVTKPFDRTNLVLGGSPAKVLREQAGWVRERI